MSVQSSGDKFSDASKTGAVLANNEEDFEKESFQSFKTNETVTFNSKLTVTIEAQPSEPSSGIVATNEPDFDRKCLFLPKGSRMLLSFEGLAQDVNFQIKTTKSDDPYSAYIVALKGETVISATPITSDDEVQKFTISQADHIFFRGSHMKDSVTDIDLHLDNIEWSTSSNKV
ncbi:hypothetical protein ACYZTM_19920 [Pseudomonas sp. MDT2-39-1]